LGAAGALQSYRSTLAEEAQTEMLATISDEAERMGRFVANLLDMTRLESGAVARAKDPVDLGELIGSTLARARKILAKHDIALDLEPDLPIITVDGVLLEQAIFNLLDNAAKYAPTGSKVTLRAWHDALEHRVKLQIMDEGPGIPASDLEAIFEKFFRVHTADHSRAGTGLGLAICRGFIEAMGGQIVASNRIDRSGAAFTISLPEG
jgi:two-component system sensor histidine kinase KdpD